MWHKVDNSAAVTIVTEDFNTCWSSDVMAKKGSWSRDLHNLMDTTKGNHGDH